MKKPLVIGIAAFVVGLLILTKCSNPTGLNGRYEAIHPIDGFLRYLTISGNQIRLDIDTPNAGRQHVATSRFRREGTKLIEEKTIEIGPIADLPPQQELDSIDFTVEENGTVIRLDMVYWSWGREYRTSLKFRKKRGIF